MKKHENIVIYIKQKIRTEQWRYDSLTPSENSLANRFGVHRLTARKALLQVKDDGWISSKRGLGYRVSKRNLSIENTSFDWATVTISQKNSLPMFSDAEKNKFLEIQPNLNKNIFDSQISFIKRVYDKNKRIYKIIKVIANPKVVKKYDEIALSKSIVGFYQHANIRVSNEKILVQNLYLPEEIAAELKLDRKVQFPVVFEVIINLDNQIVHISTIYTIPDRFLIELERKLV